MLSMPASSHRGQWKLAHPAGFLSAAPGPWLLESRQANHLFFFWTSLFASALPGHARCDLAGGHEYEYTVQGNGRDVGAVTGIRVSGC